MPDGLYWDDAYYRDMLKCRLQEIENEMPILENQIKELHNTRNKLYNEKVDISRRICEHEPKYTMYSAVKDGIWKNEVVCVKCGLTTWEEF